MIPYKEILSTSNKTCHFIHANGYPPSAYNTLLENLSIFCNIKAMLLKPHWDNKIDISAIKSWDIFYNDIIAYNKENNVNNSFGLGHSIGANLLLRSALKNHKYYSAIVLLDPTIFSPKMIYLWKFFRAIGITNVNPLIKKAKNRTIEFESLHDVFKAYRKKNIFSGINDKELNDYINSIFKITNHKAYLNYNREWEAKMYELAGLKDMEIWNNLHKLEVPTLIITPDNKPVFRLSVNKKIKTNEYIKTISIKNSTHLFPLEYPSKTLNHIISFYKEIS